MSKGIFSASVASRGWFGSVHGSNLTAAAWFDRTLVDYTTIAAVGAVTFAGIFGSGSASLSLDATGSAALGMTGSGSAGLSLDASGSALLAMVGSGSAEVAISAIGLTMFDAMVGSGAAEVALSAVGDAALSMEGAGAATLALRASGAADFDPVDGHGQASLTLRGSAAVTMEAMHGQGTATIGDVIITAVGSVVFDSMVGSGRIGIGTGIHLRDVEIVPRVSPTTITMRR